MSSPRRLTKSSGEVTVHHVVLTGRLAGDLDSKDHIVSVSCLELLKLVTVAVSLTTRAEHPRHDSR